MSRKTALEKIAKAGTMIADRAAPNHWRHTDRNRHFRYLDMLPAVRTLYRLVAEAPSDGQAIHYIKQCQRWHVTTGIESNCLSRAVDELA